ncbi:MAG TPA: hypothetical protein VJZ93_00160 [Candidatus Nanoarchaeia archaeon]|nr:hypothetical protein [Candidatus Nanoarchaeia archaeon]
MNKWVELLLGLIVLTAGIYVAWASSAYNWVFWGKDFNFLHAGWILLKGGIFWLVMILGLLLIILGLNDLRD